MKKILALLLLLCGTAYATQNATVLPTVSPYPGLTMLLNINSAFSTFQTNFSGATAPTSPVAYQWWVDTANSLLKFYDGSAWLPVAKWSGSQWVPVSNGVISTIPASTGSSNAFVVTYSPAPTALVSGQHYPFISNFSNTGAATLNVNGIGAKAITKQGQTAVAAADIPSGAVVDTVYDGTEFQMTSQLGNSAAGTVTSVATSGMLTGGTITVSGTIHGASQSNGTLLSNISGSSAEPTGNTLSAIFDYLLGSAQGGFAWRGSTGWGEFAPGPNGNVLITQGSGHDPAWTSNIPVSDLNSGSGASSSTYWRGDGTWQTAGGFTSCSMTQCTNTATCTCASGYTYTGGGCDFRQGGVSSSNNGSTPNGSNGQVCFGGNVPYYNNIICCH